MDTQLIVDLFETGMPLKEVKKLIIPTEGYGMSRDDVLEAVIAVQTGLMSLIREAYIQFLVGKLKVVWLATEEQEQNFLYNNGLDRDICGDITKKDSSLLLSYTFTQEGTEAILICMPTKEASTKEIKEGLLLVLGVRTDIPTRNIYS